MSRSMAADASRNTPVQSVGTSQPLDDGTAGGHARREPVGLGGWLGVASLSALVPGMWLLAAGRLRAGLVVLVASVLALGSVAAVVLTRPREQLVSLAVHPAALLAIAAGLVVVVGLTVANGVASARVLRRPARPRWQNALVQLVIAALVTVLAVPLLVGARYALVQRDLVTQVFAGTTVESVPSASSGAPLPAGTPLDPWAHTPRVNVLLLGSDAGPGREGARTDTVVVASIDTETGDTTMFSLPRNLEQVPFPADHPLAAIYPYGYTGDGSAGSGLLNAIYSTVPRDHPKYFRDATDPGAAAMMMAAEGALGLPVDYYVMVNLNGFQRLVDALGGVEINVRQAIPMENKVIADGVCSEPTGTIEPGKQVLDGWQAMWYARARCGGEGVSDDYDRMRRQRCMIGAMVDRADPLRLLPRFAALAKATKNMISTDIPRDRVGDFAALALRVKDAEIRSLPFTDQVISPAYADYNGIQEQVEAALSPRKDSGPGSGSKQRGNKANEGDGAQDLATVC